MQITKPYLKFDTLDWVFLALIVISLAWTALKLRELFTPQGKAEAAPRAVISARVVGARGRATVIELYVTPERFDRQVLRVDDPANGVVCYVAFDHAPAVWCINLEGRQEGRTR